MLVVFPPDVRRTLWVFMRSRHLEGFAYEEGACRRTALSVELFVDTSSDCFGKRDAPLLRPALEAAELVGGELDLCTHRDVTTKM